MKSGKGWAMKIALLACAFGLSCPSVQAQPSEDDRLQVSLLTFGPGDIYWERFCHNTIVISDLATGEAVSYNYGIFDFEEADFFVNFLRGRMRYQIAANTAQDDIDYYIAEGRSVTEQVLRFTPAQAQALKLDLDTNLLPENRHYRYDYFTSNCSTKVRDALDRALGSALHEQMVSPSRGYTYRLLADALTSPDALLMGVIDIGLGPFADQRLSFWNDSFVPMQLMSHLREVSVPDAEGARANLVVDERVLAEARLRGPPALPPDLRWPFLGLGVALAALLWILSLRRQYRGARVAFAGTTLLFSLFCGLFGLVMLGLWAFTDHVSAWHNENLLIFSPLCLMLLPTWWRSANASWSISPIGRWLAIVVAVFAAFALFSKILASFPQANLHWILLLLPTHLVLARIVSGQRPLA